jgi:hypothetical protein
MVTCAPPPGRVIIPSGPGRRTPAGARTGAASGGQALAQLPVHTDLPLPGLSSV